MSHVNVMLVIPAEKMPKHNMLTFDHMYWLADKILDVYRHSPDNPQFIKFVDCTEEILLEFVKREGDGFISLYRGGCLEKNLQLFEDTLSCAGKIYAPKPCDLNNAAANRVLSSSVDIFFMERTPDFAERFERYAEEVAENEEYEKGPGGQWGYYANPNGEFCDFEITSRFVPLFVFPGTTDYLTMLDESEISEVQFNGKVDGAYKKDLCFQRMFAIEDAKVAESYERLKKAFESKDATLLQKAEMFTKESVYNRNEGEIVYLDGETLEDHRLRMEATKRRHFASSIWAFIDADGVWHDFYEEGRDEPHSVFSRVRSDKFYYLLSKVSDDDFIVMLDALL